MKMKRKLYQIEHNSTTSWSYNTRGLVIQNVIKEEYFVLVHGMLFFRVFLAFTEIRENLFCKFPKMSNSQNTKPVEFLKTWNQIFLWTNVNFPLFHSFNDNPFQLC